MGAACAKWEVKTRATQGPAHRNCEGVLHHHVIRDAQLGTYRAQVRCACGALSRLAPTAHDGFDAANAEARAMPLVATQPEQPRSRRPAGPGRPRRTLAPITDRKVSRAEVDQAWIMWWHGLCAKQGHESRL